MAHLATPSTRKVADVGNIKPLKQSDVPRASLKSQIAWKSEIAGRIIPITNDVEEFLEHFVPGRKPGRPISHAVFNMPDDAKLERELYDPLCEGLTALVDGFASKTKLIFHNHDHARIKFPYALCESENHVTRPDVVALPPGETLLGSSEDRWRNIYFVIEAKLKESEDPMKSYSKAHEDTLIQLSKSARNILVSQSRLFVFTIGIYGRLARIFRFDHAGAVCSRAFDYTTLDGSRLLHNFLWRFTHPLNTNCTVVGADPTVSLIKTEGDRNVVARRLRDKGLEHEATAEAAKAYRYIKVNRKRYLAYDLIFINPHLFSRATTVWEAIEVDKNGKPKGNPVVIKDSWRQLVRQLESENYSDIFNSATSSSVPGIAQFLHAEDLGKKEIKSLDDRLPGGKELGHLTVTARHSVKGEHAHNERSHARLVLGTVGVPLSRFEETKEMVQALRDAIEGHRRAFEAGIMHRDVSEGNVMISRSPESSCGYLQDFDYGLNWKKLLVKLDLQSEKEDWASFVQEECAKIREQLADDTTAEFFTPLPNEFVESPVGGQEVSRPSGGDGGDGNAQVHSDVAGSVEAQSDAERTRDAERSLGTGDDPNATNDREVEAIPGVKITIGLRPVPQATNNAPASAEEVKRRWKQRTGTLYFMAVEIIKSEGSVVHEVRHDLESFFWLLVWLVLRHTHHNWGPRGCETLFDFDSEEACKEQKIGYLNREHGVLVHRHEPLNNLLEGFRELCRKNRWGPRSTPPEPLTYENVLQLFDNALKKVWPKGDKARPYTLSDGDVQSPLRPGERRVTSDLDSGRISSDAQYSQEPDNAPRPGPSGQSQSRRPGLRNRGTAGGSGSNAGGANGSRSRQR